MYKCLLLYTFSTLLNLWVLASLIMECWSLGTLYFFCCEWTWALFHLFQIHIYFFKVNSVLTFFAIFLTCYQALKLIYRNSLYIKQEISVLWHMILVFLQFVMCFDFGEFWYAEMFDMYVAKFIHFIILGPLSFKIMIRKTFHLWNYDKFSKDIF